MDTAVVNIKLSPELKISAQRVASELGISLSGIIKGFLKQLVRTKTITFTAAEEPTDYLLSALKESSKDIKAGRVSPSFDNADEAIAWLNKSRKKYVGKV